MLPPMHPAWNDVTVHRADVHRKNIQWQIAVAAIVAVEKPTLLSDHAADHPLHPGPTISRVAASYMTR